MYKCCINLFATYDRRWTISSACLRQLDGVRESLKEGVLLRVFCQPEHEQYWKKICKLMQFHTDVKPMHQDYLARMSLAQLNPYTYSIRLDDDCFLPTNTWEGILSNLETLDEPDVHCLAPIFNVGIPTTDLFVDTFPAEEDKKELHRIFKEDSVPAKPWHPQCDYTHVRERIDKMPEWDVDAYWDEMVKHNTPYKSLHPVRYSARAQMKIYQSTALNFDRFLYCNPDDFIELRGLPNTHWFATTTKHWRDAMEHRIDFFDETAMNMIAAAKNLKTLFLKRGYAIHCAFNTVDNAIEIESLYSELFIRRKLLLENG